uniref:hypothetical protein n=1 Tax=Rheinheimera sp. TaxID=1869214 RepID=UPI0040474749
MLNGYEIAMLLMIAASFVYMMWRLFGALEQEPRDKGPVNHKANVTHLSEGRHGTTMADALLQRHQEAVPAEIAKVAMKLFLNITEQEWRLTPEQQLSILGKADKFITLNVDAALNHDMLLKISHVIAIYRTLRTLFPEAQQANAWIKKKNSAFDDEAVLQLLMSGELTIIAQVRHYLEHQAL